VVSVSRFQRRSLGGGSEKKTVSENRNHRGKNKGPIFEYAGKGISPALSSGEGVKCTPGKKKRRRFTKKKEKKGETS